MFKCYIADGLRIRSFETALQYAETQSDCLRAFVQSASVCVIRNRETVPDSNSPRVCASGCVDVCGHAGGCGCVYSIYFCNLRPDIVSVPQVRVRLARNSLLPAHPPHLTTALPLNGYLSWLLVIGV